MKIVKQPVPISWSIQQSCVDTYSKLGCGAVLEVSLDDIYLNYKQNRYSSSDEDRYWHYYISETYAFKCPCCGKENLIDSKSIPERIRTYLKNTESAKKRLNDYEKKLSKK